MISSQRRRCCARLASVEVQHRQTMARLDEAIDVLIRLVRVVAAAHARLKSGGGRMDRLARDVGSGRTTDVRRLSQLERRRAALERQLS